MTNAPGEKAWPITATNFILMYKQPKNRGRRKQAKDFFKWVYANGDAQAKALDYVPLPDALVSRSSLLDAEPQVLSPVEHLLDPSLRASLGPAFFWVALARYDGDQRLPTRPHAQAQLLRRLLRRRASARAGAARRRATSTQEPGYGEDSLSLRGAQHLLRAATGNADAEVHFVSGGTQANLIALASMLKPYESVIAADTAHIHVHETGAIEATGHKISTVANADGKLVPDQVRAVVSQHGDEHMVVAARGVHLAGDRIRNDLQQGGIVGAIAALPRTRPVPVSRRRTPRTGAGRARQRT